MSRARWRRAAATSVAVLALAGCGDDPTPPGKAAFVAHGLETNVLARTPPEKAAWTKRYECLYDRTEGDPGFQAAFVEVPRGAELPAEVQATFNREIARCIVGK